MWLVQSISSLPPSVRSAISSSCPVCGVHAAYYTTTFPNRRLTSLSLQIRVVKAFQQGLDRREPSLTGPSAARLREISRQLRLQVESENKSKNERGRSHSKAAITQL
ncbi:hypothetical protein PRIPAC_77549 [Pristionchus pacificus]|uniref:ATP_Ca_trans_C domain-containing protein n=1 Tax=Pristionchus pacificus TaxID=54126 RepID=A0A2A6CBN2_PRIPA|nr:hypothetical protein PRIPAC_77549 [Pristionchus pacificus]|eukprot:PDM75526.1 hypothetical protein PRIPAC_42703 [Pristionchus pacificus]